MSTFQRSFQRLPELPGLNSRQNWGWKPGSLSVLIVPWGLRSTARSL